jgi:hypothetical protein
VNGDSKCTHSHNSTHLSPHHTSTRILNHHRSPRQNKLIHLASHQSRLRTHYTASSGNIHAAKRLSRPQYGCTTYLATSLALDNKFIYRSRKDGANKLACSSPNSLVGHRCKPQYVWCHSLHRAAGKGNRVQRMRSSRDLF